MLIKSTASYESFPLALWLRQPRLTALRRRGHGFAGAPSQLEALRLTIPMAWLYSLDGFVPRLRRLVLTASTDGVLSWGDLSLWLAKVSLVAWMVWLYSLMEPALRPRRLRFTTL